MSPGEMLISSDKLMTMGSKALVYSPDLISLACVSLPCHAAGTLGGARPAVSPHLAHLLEHPQKANDAITPAPN